jgi:hypothetical protein
VKHSVHGPSIRDPADPPPHAAGAEAGRSSHREDIRSGDTTDEAPWSQPGEWYGHIHMFFLRSSTDS